MTLMSWTVTFSAATVLLAATCSSPERVPYMSATEFSVPWEKVILILEYHRGRIHSAEKAIQVLKTLRDKLQSSRSAVDTNIQKHSMIPIKLASSYVLG